MRSILAIAVLALFAESVSAHSYFYANTEHAQWIGYTHSGNFFYNFTSDEASKITKPHSMLGTDVAVMLEDPLVADETKLLTSYVNSTGDTVEIDPPSYGYFTPEDIMLEEPEVYGGIYDLFQHACKGELMLMYMIDGQEAMAPVEYKVSEDPTHAKPCEEAAQPYKPVADSTVVTSTSSTSTNGGSTSHNHGATAPSPSSSAETFFQVMMSGVVVLGAAALV